MSTLAYLATISTLGGVFLLSVWLFAQARLWSGVCVALAAIPFALTLNHPDTAAVLIGTGSTYVTVGLACLVAHLHQRTSSEAPAGRRAGLVRLLALPPFARQG